MWTKIVEGQEIPNYKNKIKRGRRERWRVDNNKSIEKEILKLDSRPRSSVKPHLENGMSMLFLV